MHTLTVSRKHHLHTVILLASGNVIINSIALDTSFRGFRRGCARLRRTTYFNWIPASLHLFVTPAYGGNDETGAARMTAWERVVRHIHPAPSPLNTIGPPSLAITRVLTKTYQPVILAAEEKKGITYINPHKSSNNHINQQDNMDLHHSVWRVLMAPLCPEKLANRKPTIDEMNAPIRWVNPAKNKAFVDLCMLFPKKNTPLRHPRRKRKKSPHSVILAGRRGSSGSDCNKN